MIYRRNGILYKINGVLYKYTDPLSGLDIDAKKLILNGQIYDPTVWLKINTLVLALKADGTWTKFKAIWPLRGGKLLSAKLNAINPQSTNTAFRLEFRNNSNANQPSYVSNGVNFAFGCFARTFFLPSVHMAKDNFTIGFYRRNDLAVTAGIDMGSIANNSANQMWLAARRNNLCELRFGEVALTVANTNAIGAYLGTKTPTTNARIYKGTTQIASTATAAVNALPDNDMGISCINVNNSGLGDAQLIAGQYGYAFAATGLTDTEAQLVQTRFIDFVS